MMRYEYELLLRPDTLNKSKFCVLNLYMEKYEVLAHRPKESIYIYTIASIFFAFRLCFFFFINFLLCQLKRTLHRRWDSQTEYSTLHCSTSRKDVCWEQKIYMYVIKITVRMILLLYSSQVCFDASPVPDDDDDGGCCWWY